MEFKERQSINRFFEDYLTIIVWQKVKEFYHYFKKYLYWNMGTIISEMPGKNQQYDLTPDRWKLKEDWVGFD